MSIVCRLGGHTRLLVWLLCMAPWFGIEQTYGKTFTNPPTVCDSASNTISNPVGTVARVTVKTPLGTKISSDTYARNSLLGVLCSYDIGDEDLASSLDGEKAVDLIMEAGVGYPLLDNTYGVMVSLPSVTNEYGVAMQIQGLDGVPLAVGKQEWKIGVAEIQYYFDNGKITMNPYVDGFSYSLVKVLPATNFGFRQIGQYSGIFSVKWVYHYGQADAKVLGRSTVNMTTSSLLGLTSQGCRYSNVTQSLPRVQRTQFSAVGTTWGDTDVNLSINCYGGPMVSLSMQPRHTYEGRMDMGIGLVDSTNSFGVGVQLLKREGSSNPPWNFSVVRPLDEAKEINTEVEISIPLRARYYQTNKTVQPGRFSVVYTITLTYN